MLYPDVVNENFINIVETYHLLNKFLSQKKINLIGYVDNYDFENKDSYITRKNVAKLCHFIMQFRLMETDISDWSAALELKDIYDCHSCVNNIAQVYAKGVMTAYSNSPIIFGNDNFVSYNEVEQIADRLFNNEKRFVVPVKGSCEVKEICLPDLDNLSSSRVIDVREILETNYYIKGKIVEHIPLKRIIQNPLQIGNDFSRATVLCCKKGYQSRLAAEVLRKTGYNNLYILKFDF